MTRTASLKAFAKLNLGLRVLARRPDGFHELRTIFQTISLADRLSVTFTPARKTAITVTGAPEILDNLVERSCRMLLENMKMSATVAFHLDKVIPTGAGLGGGSSDAAAVLLSIPVLAGKKVKPEIVMELAAQLGSDVPFFLRGGTALGLGRGEELYPLPDVAGSKLLVIAPPVHSSTVQAYRDLSAQLTFESVPHKVSSFQELAWKNGDVAPANDFEEVIFERHPELAQIKRRLLRLGATYAAMTGSGSAIFGVFKDSEKLLKARNAFSGCRVFAVSFVSRARYQSSWMRALQPHVKGNEWVPQSLYAR
jgi:4-diphosphocytidyl-2-C-methyl-D-erythritol kinase